MAGDNKFCDLVFNPIDRIQNGAHVQSMDQYREMYDKSVQDPAAFWGEIAQQFHWKESPKSENFLQYNFARDKGPISIKWMEGAVTNICYNTLDRHVKNGLADKVVFFWEGNDPGDCKQITYGELLREVCKFANVLKSKGIGKGDRVAMYMPMIIELVVAMLACARIGAMHSIIFGGFSADSVADRIIDGQAKLVVTADASYRGTKLIQLKSIVDDALKIVEKKGHAVGTSIVVRHMSSKDVTNGADDEHPAKRPCRSLQVAWTKGRDEWWHDLMKDVSEECEPEWMQAEDPLFMLYTSGSTGVPKGVVHTTAGYMLYTATTFKYSFDFHLDDVYWCTADIGWITGHSYVTYGPMLNGATSVIFEGVPIHPDAGRFWDVIDKYNVSIFYTAPTAIRALMKFGDQFVTKYKRTSLRILGTVGEPINPEAWLWYYNVVGDKRCAVVDTFWQTETGGHTITPLPGCTPTKPGSATFPFFGVVPKLLSEEGVEIEGEGDGYLVFSQPWPGIMRTVYGNHPRFEKTYFSKFEGYYCTGDGAHRDKDGYIYITGRIDDMMNCSGHLLSTAQIESALVEHPSISEAAVVSQPHEVKGEVPYCFVTLKNGCEFTDDLVRELKNKVREKIGPFATPDGIQDAPGLPKTRSGKIMRRVLRKISRGERDIGDTTTLADSSVVDNLFAGKERADSVTK